MDLDNTKLFTFCLCKMKQLNLRHFHNNSNKFFETVHFFQQEAKTTPKRPILFCLVYQGVFGQFTTIYFRYLKATEDSRRLSKTDFLRLTKRSDHSRRCPKNPPNT